MTSLSRPISFRVFHTLAALATLAPVLIMVAILSIHDSGLYDSEDEPLLRVMPRMAAAAIDDVLTAWANSLERLALADLDAEQPARTREMLDAYLADHPATRSLALLDRDGTPGVEVGVLSDREIVAVAAIIGSPATFSGPKLRLTGLLQGMAGGRSLIGLAVPLDGAGPSKRVLLAIGQVHQFNTILTANDAWPGMQAAVIDQYGMVMVDSDPAAVGQPFPRLQSQARENETSIRQISLSGTAFYVAARHTNVSPWCVVYLVPRANLNGAPQQFLIGLAVFIGLLIMSLATSGLTGRYLSRRIEALAGAAELVSNEATPFAMKPSGLREIDAIHKTLRRAGVVAQQQAAACMGVQEAGTALHARQGAESPSQAATRVAHDLGNLIFAIRGDLELLKRTLSGNERSQMTVDNILKVADEVAKLSLQLCFSDQYTQNRERRLNVGEFLREAVGLFRQVAGRAITVTLEVDADPCDCHLDPSRLKSALLNLIVNARHAMPRGGEIRIGSRNLVLDDRTAAAVGVTSAGRYVALSVADPRVGNPQDVRPHLFEPFFTTKEGDIGMGLGLSLLYGFVTSTGGHVLVDSVVGAGTTFTMYLPAEPARRVAIHGA